MTVFKIAANFGLPALALALTLPVFAAPVQYSTTGDFTGGSNVTSGTATYTDTNGGTAAFVGMPTQTLNTPIADSLGNIVVTIPTNTSSITGSGNFTLTIVQTVPGPSSGDFTSGFSGKISGTASGPSGQLILTFNQTSIIIDGVKYALEDLGQNGLGANQLGIGVGSNNNIEAFITTVTPEPTFMMLSGLGFAGLAFVAYRRKRTA